MIMIYIAFTLGLFGSLHCLGMCGPLAFALLPGLGKGSKRDFILSMGYNIGRTISYTILGVLSGLVGGLLNIAGFQKPLSIVAGVVLLVLFLMSMDLEKALFKSSGFRNLYHKYRQILSRSLSHHTERNSILMGMLNGLIPCGLVYLALAGSVATGNLLEGITFMFFFGLGTFPMMIVLLTSSTIVKPFLRKRNKHLFSYLQLIVGMVLIFRGLAIDIPANLELFWSMGNVNCH